MVVTDRYDGGTVMVVVMVVLMANDMVVMTVMVVLWLCALVLW